MSSKIKTLISLVKKEENYIPRNYQTIGGMWTVDDYKEIEKGKSEISVTDMYGILIVVLLVVYFCFQIKG